ncbi:sensor histidine kinase [Bacillus tianshenii]|uniref:sensor histidine kinase n=1 Tax=Sutcliffiella tianshenii TaxID=1463404 RepID=UPI001CD81A94|nr:sensor histidine kinase [Bacillus tianshenii]MCA1321773.1 sensor histidine kinase [Bacillus tianshenii]
MRSILLWAKLAFICTCLVLIPIYQTLSQAALPAYFVIAGAFLAIYFTLPLWKMRWAAYALASSLLAVLQIFILEPSEFLPWLLFYFLIIDGMVSKSQKSRTLNLVAVLLPFSTVFFHLNQPEQGFFHALLSVLLIGIGALLQAYYSDNEKIDKEWKALLVEYRLLKRQVAVSEEVARVEERNRIARDIHDSVGHQLTALMMQLAVAEQSAKESENVSGILAQSKQLARESLDGMRKAVKALRGEEEKGIASVIHLIRKLEAESRMRVQLTTKTGVLSVPLTNEQNIAIYRFVQEGLTNAMRHGSSREIAVTVEIIGEHSLQIAVVNKIDGPLHLVEGFGMDNMRKRMEALQGRVVRVVTDGDFTIKGIFPLKGDT